MENCREKCHLESGGVSRLRKPKTTMEERVEKARKYLREHPLMRVGGYAWLTGQARAMASMELHRISAIVLCEEGKLLEDSGCMG